MRSLNKFVVAVFLLFIFTQGVGLRLWMHYWFHESGVAKTTGLSSSAELKAKCECLQDATTPLQAAAAPSLAPVPVTYISTVAANHFAVHSIERIFSALRGPPIAALQRACQLFI